MTYDDLKKILKDNKVAEDSMFLFLKFVVNYKVKFSKALDVGFHGNIFCPFHADTSKPSAKVYKDLKGERLYCFAESKMYFPFDYVTQIKGYDYKELALKILSRYSSYEIKSMLKLFSSDTKFVKKDFSTLEGFKTKEITFQQFITNLQDIMFTD